MDDDDDEEYDNDNEDEEDGITNVGAFTNYDLRAHLVAESHGYQAA